MRRYKDKGSKTEDCPGSVKQFVAKGTKLFKSKPDGACAFNSAAFFLYGDERKAAQVRKLVNLNIVENFDHYKNKIVFPYERKVGGLKSVKFNENQKED